jgi:hypothetical protein
MPSSRPAIPWPRCCDRRVGRNSALIHLLAGCFASTRAQEVFRVSLQMSYLSWHQRSYCASSLFAVAQRIMEGSLALGSSRQTSRVTAQRLMRHERHRCGIFEKLT